MSATITTTQLIPPPVQSKAVKSDGTVAEPLRQYLFTLERSLQLTKVDTTGGAAVIALPAAGLDSTTGESAQGSELIYRKISPDANTVTITGSADGTQVLTSNVGAASRVRFASDGSEWLVVG
jgi:hypothetical protein